MGWRLAPSCGALIERAAELVEGRAALVGLRPQVRVGRQQQ